MRVLMAAIMGVVVVMVGMIPIKLMVLAVGGIEKKRVKCILAFNGPRQTLGINGIIRCRFGVGVTVWCGGHGGIYGCYYVH